MKHQLGLRRSKAPSSPVRTKQCKSPESNSTNSLYLDGSRPAEKTTSAVTTFLNRAPLSENKIRTPSQVSANATPNSKSTTRPFPDTKMSSFTVLKSIPITFPLVFHLLRSESPNFSGDDKMFLLRAVNSTIARAQAHADMVGWNYGRALWSLLNELEFRSIKLATLKSPKRGR